MDRAERILLFGALGMLLVSAGLGDGLATGALGGSAPALRAHVHSGSLGWITLAVLAVALRIAAGPASGQDTAGRAGEQDATGARAQGGWRDCRGGSAWAGPLSWLTVAATLAFVVTDAFGSPTARAWTGAAALVMIAAFTGLLGWMVNARRKGEAGTEDRPGSGAEDRAPWTVASLGMGAALVVLVAGSALGALAAGAAASGNAASLASLLSAHSATLSVPFVVLAATSMLEWAARPPGPEVQASPSTAGLVQVGALVLAAAALIAGVLARDLALVEANIPLELGGIAIFAVRIGPALLTTGLLTRGAGSATASRPWLGTAAVALAVDVGLVAHLVFEVGQRRYVTAAMIPRWLPFAVDHVTFVAVGTACLFGVVAAMADRQENARWYRADVLAAAGLAAGLAGTTVGIGVGSAVLEGASGTVLGLSVLTALTVAAIRVRAISPAAWR
jgi:hypothetical protein